MTPDILYDQIIGMGCARKLKFSWGGNPGVGSLHRMRDAVENGWPRPLELEEHRHAAMANAYEAGAANLPFAVFRGYIGTDLPKVNPKIRSVTCPFTGEVLAAVPAIRPDVTIIHALRADRDGNVLHRGHRRRPEGGGARGEALHRHGGGGGRRFRPAERQRRRSCRLDGRAPSAVVPGGAFPSYAHGYYSAHNAFYIAWDPIARDRDTSSPG